MALISCPECNRQVSDKALSGPGCGYPLRQEPSSTELSAASSASEQPATERKDILITGPNGLPLLEEMVKDFASFIEWLFGVKLNKDDGDFIRQALMEEWSRNDQHAYYFGNTCILLRERFKLATEYQLGREGHSDTRDYWRQALMYDLDLTAFGSMPSTLRKIGERLKVEPARKRLRPTEEHILPNVSELIIFMTSEVYSLSEKKMP
jgi:hypothetical protein